MLPVIEVFMAAHDLPDVPSTVTKKHQPGWLPGWLPKIQKGPRTKIRNPF
jgi:hypothetical protein